jgi:cysteine synthase
MQHEPHPEPRWVVTSAGTGGTSATIGRYIRYHSRLTQITQQCVVDPDHSVFYDYYQTGNAQLTHTKGSAIEGIGRPRVEPSFIRSLIDKMIKVPDAASMATIMWLEAHLGRACGGSTGTNVYGALQLIAAMHERNESGSVVSIICDGGERYADTYFNASWRQEHYPNHLQILDDLNSFIRTGINNFPKTSS